MDNLYEYLDISISATKKQIIEAYKQKISKYLPLTSLSDKEIYEIKMLKVGLYILTNDTLKHKYNILIKLEKPNLSTYDVACSLRPISTSNRRHDQNYSAFSH